MPFPVAAAIAYGMIAGGGLAGAGAAFQRLWRYFQSSPEEQDLEDEKLTPFLKTIVSALAYAQFGEAPDLLPTDQQKRLAEEAKTIAPRLKRQLNDAARERFGKTFSRLSKPQKEMLMRELADEHEASGGKGKHGSSVD